MRLRFSSVRGDVRGYRQEMPKREIRVFCELGIMEKAHPVWELLAVTLVYSGLWDLVVFLLVGSLSGIGFGSRFPG